jgi:DNA-binding transcriptional LysR family regulator
MSSASLASTLPNLEAFCKTYETGSFTRAARLLGVTPQATSRSVARLEQELGVTLFRRTTRSLAPSDEAVRYYERCVQALALLSTGERELAIGKQAPEGEVRISVPTTYGHHCFLPSLGAFRERYPKIRLEASVSNTNVDFVRDGFDLAIRMGQIRDQGLIARRLDDSALGVYASPAYLARRRVPRTPAQLSGHSCIAFVMPSTGRVLPWTFVPGPERFAPNAEYRVSEDVLGAVSLARAGIGLVQIYDFIVRDDVARGLLVEVLAPYRGASRPFSLLRPKSVRPTHAVRALSDFILEHARAERRRQRDRPA